MAFKQSGRVSDLSVEGMADYLLSEGVRNTLVAEFKRNLVSGAAFLQLTEEDLKELVPLIGERVLLRQLLRQCKADNDSLKQRVGSGQAIVSSHPNTSIPIPDGPDRTTGIFSHSLVPIPNNTVHFAIAPVSISSSHMTFPNSVNSVPSTAVPIQASPGIVSTIPTVPSATNSPNPASDSVIPVSSPPGSNGSVSNELLSYPTYSPSLMIESPSGPSPFVNESYEVSNVSETEKEGNTVDDPDWHLSFAIPEKHTFFQAVQDSIETGLVTPRAKRGLIQVLRTLIIQHTKYPSRDEYNVVCKKLIEKYPKLHDGGQSGCESWKICLRNSFKNFRRVQCNQDGRRPRKRRNSTEAIPSVEGVEPKREKVCEPHPIMSEEEYEGIVLKLQEESGSGQLRNEGYVRQLLDRSLGARHRWIKEKSPSVVEVLEKFPVLDNSDVLRYEFKSILETDQSFSDMITRWEELKPLIVRICKVEAMCRVSLKPLVEEYESLCADGIYNPTDQSDYVVLNILLKLLHQREVKGRMFIKRLETCDIVDVSCDADEDAHQVVPCIVFTAEPGSIEARYFIYYDKLAVCECSSLRDAFVDLIAAYHVFHIPFPKVLSGVLLFFQHEVFEVRDKQVHPMNLFTLVSNLQKLKNDL